MDGADLAQSVVGRTPIRRGAQLSAATRKPKLSTSSVKRRPVLRVTKAQTGISGLDELTSGGLPKGRPTLVCGSAGCGKTVLGLEFLVRGATQFGEPGAVFSFEETSEDLAANVASFGFDLAGLIAEKKLVVDHVRIDRAEVEETGAYDLDGLFIRLEYAIDSIGAKRVLLDTIETLFVGLTNKDILRSELRRLFSWLKDKGVTAVITGERGENTLTRNGLEEYVSDCVILLDLRVEEQIATRRLRVVKYRGSRHGADEYPFFIGENGVSVLPVASVRLVHEASEERVSSGNAELDVMLGGGYYRGSSILVSGSSGSGKTSVAAALAATCKQGERALYFSFEESPAQLIRNMKSIGLNLASLVKKGLLEIISTRPSGLGLETHLFLMFQAIEKFRPSLVIVDPVTDFVSIGSNHEIRAMTSRLVDHLKTAGITALLTSLNGTTRGKARADSEAGLSSLIDTWIMLDNFEVTGERNRAISVLKSRGTAHSNQVREFVLSQRGLTLIQSYRDADGFVMGSQREAQQRSDAENGNGTLNDYSAHPGPVTNGNEAP
jgi:circadian clock protein KaiC